jgi:hypothetical protein
VKEELNRDMVSLKKKEKESNSNLRNKKFLK